MASNPSRGVPSIGAALIRPTQPEQIETLETVRQGADDDASGGQGSGTAEPRTAATKGRRRRVDRPQDKTGKRGLYLTASVWQRLQLEAIRKGMTVSAVAGDVLDRNLPRLRIEREA